MRMEDYHTHYLGKTDNGKLFFGSETFAHLETKEQISSGTVYQNRIDLAILYLFDKNGKFLSYKHWSTTIDTERNKTEEKLQEMIKELGKTTFCDIELETFEVNINGIKCGLIPNEEFVSIDLYPSNTISFQEPWDGEYYT
jgi:formate hydrogenlyase regulatory protein HycA